MKRLKTIIIFSIEFLVIFYCITGTAFGTNSTDTMSVQSGDYLNSKISNVDYDNYNYFFGLNSYGNTVITRYGKLPDLKTEEQKESWKSSLEELSEKIKDTIVSEYMYPHGEIVTCGTNSQGYFLILFRYGNVDEPLLDDIYVLIDNSAKEMGVQDIPVEFGYGIYQAEIPLDLEHGIYQTYGENVENLSESKIRAIEEYMKEKPEQLSRRYIANYGEIPLLKNRTEIHSWGSKLYSIKNGTEEKITLYFDRGQVLVYGIELTRLFVDIYDGLPSEEKAALVEEIYQIIDEEARKQNVTDIPVVFAEIGYIQPSEEVIEDVELVEDTANFSISEKNDEEFDNSTNNDPESENGNSSSGDKSSGNNSAPGFGLLGSLTCLYGGWKLRKK